MTDIPTLSKEEIKTLKTSLRRPESMEDNPKISDMFSNPRKSSTELASLFIVAYDSLSGINTEIDALNVKIAEYVRQFKPLMGIVSSLIDDMDESQYGGHTRKGQLLNAINENRSEIIALINNAQRWIGCFIAEDDEGEEY